MTDEPSRQPPRSRKRRIILGVVLGGLLLIVLANALLPELELYGEDRIAVIRVEGVILDAQSTMGT